MKARNDEELLQGWSRDRCEESFRVLVERYADLVYGTALRRTGDRQAAEEVAQNVFAALARKAMRLDGADGLGGWLFKTTVLEAAAWRRRETRRMKRMRELSELEGAQHEGGGKASTGDVLHSLDEELANLAAPERAILIARFFNGSSFAELARASGRSEAACRKQASRAMRKLAGRLQRRGLRVSSAVLAASLGALTATKAPAGLAGQWVTGAVAAKTAAGPVILTAIVTTMSTTKLTSVAAIGIVLILASSGAGFMAGRQHAKTEQSGTGPGDTALSAAHPAAKSGRRGSGRIVSRPGDGPENPVTRVEEIVRALKEALRDGEVSVEDESVRAIAAKLQAPDMAEAVSLVAGEAGDPGTLGRALLSVLFGRWGELDGAEALERAAEFGGGAEDRAYAMRPALRHWARVDPRGAWEWLREWREGGDLPVSELVADGLPGAVLREWAGQDMDAAWDEFERLPPDQQRNALPELDDLIDEPEHREAMGRRMAAIEDERLRSWVAEDVGERWARIDPDGVTAWFETVEFEDPMLRLRAAMEIGERLFDADPMRGVTWLWPMVPEPMRDHFARELARSPGGRESADLRNWLEEQGYDLAELQSH